MDIYKYTMQMELGSRHCSLDLAKKTNNKELRVYGL